MDGAFLICGHGGEHRRTFTVPKGCIIIVHVHYGEQINRDVYLPMIGKLHRVNINVLRDPLATEHLPILLQIYKRFAVYQEGEECPDFGYLLFDCDSSTDCYVVPMGVIDMEKWAAPLSYVKQRKIAESARKEDIIKHFSHPYRNSIIPTEQAIKDKVETIIEQHPPSLLRAIFKGIREMTHKTLSELCEFRKGVYYHTLCREKRDVTKALRRPITNIITLYKNIQQIQRLPPSESHTRKKASNAIARKRGMIDALTYRIGETVKHRTPYIKQMMNSPMYQLRRREEVKKELRDIEYRIQQLKQMIAVYKGEITRSATRLESDLPSVEAKQKEAQEKVTIYSAELQLREKRRNNLIEWVTSMDTSPSPPISYVKENTMRWKSDPESYPEASPEAQHENTHQHIIEAERYGKRHVRNSYANHLYDEREQLQRMRNAHARFKKGRNEYMKDPSGNANEYEKDMDYLTNEMKGYEKGIKRLEYLTNVVPPFHTTRVKIDKNEQLQGMRNAHARFTTSRKKYMDEKASNSHTNQYKKNVNYFNRVLRDYEKGIHNAENPSNSYTRVKQNGTIKWVRK